MDIRRVLEMPIVKDLKAEKELLWLNPHYSSETTDESGLSFADIEAAEARLLRFAPFIMTCFPQTKEKNGLIESELADISLMKERLNQRYDAKIGGRLLLKKDSHLAIAGSIKARGGIYEVLKYTEELALASGLLKEGESYDKLASEECRTFFGKHTVQVGSTGNLGLSIGIMSAAIGFKVIVHMSADAKAWKKDLLRSYSVQVVEYESDYGEAVKNGRRLSDEDPMSYFVDDENSKNLFLGYAVAAKRLQKQLKEQNIPVDAKHPLFVYIPCGVGGAPGGIVFGLKQLFGENVHCFFVEPTKAPCMLLGMATGENGAICVQDIGLSGQTHADGLAVGRPSGFVGAVMKSMLSGIFTIEDAKLYEYMRDLLASEEIFIEPSAAAAFQGIRMLQESEQTKKYLQEKGLTDRMSSASHIVWATGGRLVPESIREEYRNIYL